MEAMYIAEAILEDRRRIETTGSIMECANWCDNVIRCNSGPIEIHVREIGTELRKTDGGSR